MDFQIQRLFTLDYYFASNPGGEFLLGYALLVFFVLAVMSGSLVKKFGPQNKYFKKTIKKQFGKSTVPDISGFSFEVDARDTNGKAQVFIKSISFYSP